MRRLYKKNGWKTPNLILHEVAQCMYIFPHFIDQPQKNDAQEEGGTERKGATKREEETGIQ